MATYSLSFLPRSTREFDNLPEHDFKRIKNAIDLLAENPRPIGVKKLGGKLHRVRVGDWRVIFAILDKEKQIIILRVTRRSEQTYRWIKEIKL